MGVIEELTNLQAFNRMAMHEVRFIAEALEYTAVEAARLSHAYEGYGFMNLACEQAYKAGVMLGMANNARRSIAL